MAKRKPDHSKEVEQAVTLLKKMPPKYAVAIVLLVLIGIAIYAFTKSKPGASRRGDPPMVMNGGAPGTYLLCSWNVENFYDDVDDPKSDDKEEDFFANNPQLFQKKIDRLAEALLMMNNGLGPDIFACVEVESMRCLEQLVATLNAQLEATGHADATYRNIAFVQDVTGRRFAPGVITRLGMVHDRTRKLGSGGLRRSLEAHVRLNGHSLIVICSHWTSRVSGGEVNRMRYAESLYGRLQAITTADPDADVLLCGDYNDDFADPSIQQGLHATNDPQATIDALDQPRPYDLMTRIPASYDPPGTIYGKGHWSIFDPLIASRGLLDPLGWEAQLDTVAIFGPDRLRKSNGQPLRFWDSNNPGVYGYADHLPVLVRLKNAGLAEGLPADDAAETAPE